MRKDAALLDTLSPIALAIDTLAKKLADTTMQVGAEAYAAARTIYTVTKTTYASAQLQTASDALAKRYGRKRKTATPAPAAPGGTHATPLRHRLVLLPHRQPTPKKPAPRSSGLDGRGSGLLSRSFELHSSSSELDRSRFELRSSSSELGRSRFELQR